MEHWRQYVAVYALIVALCTTFVSGDCVMTQKCLTNTKDGEKCIPEANKMPVPPQPMIGPGWANVTGGGVCETDKGCNDKGSCINQQCRCNDDGMVAGPFCNESAIQCPEYKQNACCTWQQNQKMAENFKLLANVFGKNSVGGCDACASNLMSLWCGLVCSPQQSEFMKMHLPYPSTNDRPDPISGEDHVKVLELDVTLSKPMTCALFSSCKDTATASLAEGMKSSLGFLKFQAQAGAISHGEYMFLHFSNTPNTTATAFDHNVLSCSNYSETADQAVKSQLPTQAQQLASIATTTTVDKQCPCAACRATCGAHPSNGSSDHIVIVANPISIWDGFNYKIVTCVYGAAIVIIMAVHWRSR